MREYGQVQSAFWQSSDAQAMSDTGKMLAIYLLTGPHTNGIGCFRLPDGYVMADLGWDSERVSKGFRELSETGFANRYEGVVFVPNFLRWNRIANGNIAKARFNEFEQLPKGEAKSRAARAMLEFCAHWDEGQKRVMQRVTETLSKGYANQNHTQPYPERTLPREEKEREKTEHPESPPPPPAEPPKSVNRSRGAVALGTWLDSLPDPDQAIPPDDPIFRYATDTGIPVDFLELAWVQFCGKMRDGGKRKKDWRAHFRNAVRHNWFRLWWFDSAAGGMAKLTTAGEQARRTLAAANARAES